MKHTCDTVRSGSEKGNTCAACHDGLAKWQKTHPPDYSWLYEDRKLIRPRHATSSEPGR